METRKCKKRAPRTYPGVKYNTMVALMSHVVAARKKYPEFEGIKCVMREVADLIKAEESGDRMEIRKQALHLAVTALRLYERD